MYKKQCFKIIYIFFKNNLCTQSFLQDKTNLYSNIQNSSLEFCFNSVYRDTCSATPVNRIADRKRGRIQLAPVRFYVRYADAVGGGVVR